MDWIIIFKDENGEIINDKWMNLHLSEMIKDVESHYGNQIQWLSITAIL